MLSPKIGRSSGKTESISRATRSLLLVRTAISSPTPDRGREAQGFGERRQRGPQGGDPCVECQSPAQAFSEAAEISVDVKGPGVAEVRVAGRPDRVLHERWRLGAIARETGDADLPVVAAQTSFMSKITVEIIASPRPPRELSEV